MELLVHRAHHEVGEVERAKARHPRLGEIAVVVVGPRDDHDVVHGHLADQRAGDARAQRLGEVVGRRSRRRVRRGGGRDARRRGVGVGVVVVHDRATPGSRGGHHHARSRAVQVRAERATGRQSRRRGRPLAGARPEEQDRSRPPRAERHRANHGAFRGACGRTPNATPERARGCRNFCKYHGMTCRGQPPSGLRVYF